MAPVKKPFLVRFAFTLFVGVALALLPAAETKPDREWQWFKGNLHTHTVNSDGDSAPDAVARWYKEHGYQFLVLTDHNFLTEPAGLNSIFAATDKFLLVSGEEVTAKFDEIPIHVNAFNIRQTIPPAEGGSVRQTFRNNVNAILEAGGMPSLNHPNFHWAINAEDIVQVSGLKLFEVYNGHPGVNNAGGGGSAGLDQMWDTVLTAGRQVYGIAVDDAHSFKVFGPEYSNPGRGWVSIRATELSTRSLLEALSAGEFYASNGVELEEVTRLPRGLRIKIQRREDFKYTTEFIGPRGAVLAKTFDDPAEYTLKAGESYVRAKVIDSKGDVAWVQPVFAR